MGKMKVIVVTGLVAMGLVGAGSIAVVVAIHRPDLRTFSEGDRTGQVTKLSFRSTFEAPEIRQGCSNWEGELSMSNSKIVHTGGDEPTETGGNTFEFSLPRRAEDSLYNTSELAVQQGLHNAQVTGHRVLLHYIQVAKHDTCASRTDYLIVGVEDLDAEGRPVLGGRVSLKDVP